MRIHAPAAVLACALALVACGGGGGVGGSTAAPPPAAGGGTPPPPPPPTRNAVGGIWQGSIPAFGVTLVGLVAENGDFHFIQSDEVQYFGSVSANGSSLAGSYVGVAPVGFTFMDGARTGTGTLAGTVTARTTMNAQSAFRTALGNASSTNFTLTYNPTYERPSSLATIAGNYRDPGGAIVNINASGVVFSQDPASSCVINGQVSIIDARFNTYRVEYSFSGCRGADVVLNGTTARGLGALDNSVSPERAIIGVVNQAAGYSYAGIFPRT